MAQRKNPVINVHNQKITITKLKIQVGFNKKTRNVSIGHGCPHLCTNDKPEYVQTDGRTDKGKSKCPPPFSGGIKIRKPIKVRFSIYEYPSFIILLVK